MMPEKDEYGNYNFIAKSKSGRDIALSRFQMMPVLGQTYLVDNTSRWIDFRLRFVEKNQKLIMGGESVPNNKRRMRGGNLEDAYDTSDSDSDDDLDDEEDFVVEEHDTNSKFRKQKKCFLSQSHHGSRRHLRKKSRDALSLVAEYGRPTFFLTLTCNPDWEELQEVIPEDHNAYIAADRTVQVFKMKLDKFLENLRNGHYFSSYSKDGTIKRYPVYIVDVIEYQNRGLPHAHIVYQLTNSPSTDSEITNTVSFIDEFVHSTKMYPSDNDTEEDYKYQELVHKCMIHTCRGGDNGCLNEHGICKRGYNKIIIPETFIDERGFPVYKRPPMLI
jgi:hypothetical protein